MAVGNSGYVTTSTDGITWTTPVQVGANNVWYGVAYGDGKFVAVGQNGYIISSTDGITWTTPVQVSTNHWTSVAYGDGKFVAVGQNGYITTLADDSATWTTPMQLGTNGWNGIAYGNNTFVIVGDNRYVEVAPTFNPNTFHQIFIQMNMPTAYTINLGLGSTPHWLTEEEPDLSEAGNYDIFYEYDKANQYWKAAAMKQGEGS